MRLRLSTMNVASFSKKDVVPVSLLTVLIPPGHCGWLLGSRPSRKGPLQAVCGGSGMPVPLWFRLGGALSVFQPSCPHFLSAYEMDAANTRCRIWSSVRNLTLDLF